jgi:hypothetical protein
MKMKRKSLFSTPLVSTPLALPLLRLAFAFSCSGEDGGGTAAAVGSVTDRRLGGSVGLMSSGGMPESGSGNAGCNGGDPGDPGCVTAAEFELIQRWVAAGTPE